MPKPKPVAVTPDRSMVGKKVRIELDGPTGPGGTTVKITGWIIDQHTDNDQSEETTVLSLAVAGKIIC